MFRYHTVYPENTKSSYGEFDTVDFVVTFENRALVANSMRLESDLNVYSTGTTKLAATDQIYVDPKIGAHSFVSAIQTEFQSRGMVENLQEYPRYVKMVGDTTMTVQDTMNSENTCELRAPSEKVMLSVLRGPCLNTRATVDDNDFSIKPRFCLNSMSANLNYTKSGAIRVSVRLGRNAAALYGAGVTADSSYSLKNLRLCFSSAPPVGSGKVMLRTKLNIKQAINTAFANVATKVPAVCNAVSCSFQRQDQENTNESNNTQTQVLPNVSEVQFLFNDSQSEYITYQIRDREELLLRYIQSFADVGRNSVNLSKLKANESFGIGLPFRDLIDLSNQKFNVQIVSEVGINPFIMYMYFHSMVEV